MKLTKDEKAELVRITEWIQEIASRLRDKWDQKSDNWQTSERGEESLESIEDWIGIGGLLEDLPQSF